MLVSAKDDRSRRLGTVRPNFDRIDGATFGTSAILQEWMDRMNALRVPQIDTLIINLRTIIRNVLNDDTSDVASQVSRDIETLVTHFNALGTHMKYRDTPTVIIMNPSYHKLPKFYLKDETKSEKSVDDAQKELVKRGTFAKSENIQQFDTMMVYTKRLGVDTLPHLELLRYIPSVEQAVRNRTRRTYGIITSYALDYHLLSHLGHNGYVIASHTGDHWPSSALGSKVFKTPYVPFNRTTHLLLGDNTLMRRMLNNRDRRIALELAKDHKWFNKTEAQILKEVNGFIPAELLTKLTLKL